MPTNVMELRRELDLPVGARSLLPLRDFIRRCLFDAGISDEQARPLMVAIDAAAAAATVGNGSDVRKGHLTVLVEVNDTRLRVLVADHSDGTELQADSGDAALRQACRPRQELALSLLRRVMDEVHYKYVRGFQNELEMIRFL